jgi:putative transposase
MAHTLTQLPYHIVYSTKDRRNLIGEELMSRLVQFTGGLIRHRKGSLLAMNGTANHVHLLCLLAADIAVSKQMQEIKSISCGWIKDTLPNLRHFAWQEGYGGFGVGLDGIPKVRRYIASQPNRHQKETFEDEYLSMLKRAGIDYDPRFVFG